MLAKEIVEITKGRLLSGDPHIKIAPSKISTDSRMLKKGDFFAALKGPNFDGNDFLKDAFRTGAIGALVGRFENRDWGSEKVIIQVKDSTMALQDIAGHHRNRFKIPVIGVTGSNGKTTVKEMLAQILSKKYNVLKNEGTKNNHIGVPQTLLRLKSCHDICVLELGANHRGEIKRLCDIARPTIAVITNIGPSHLHFFQDLKGVFEAKKEILDSLGEKDIAALNGDDPFLSKIKSKRFRIVKFGLKRLNNFFPTSVSIVKDNLKFTVVYKPQGAGRLRKIGDFRLRLLGIHNLRNALAAIAVASEFNIGYEATKKAFFDFRPTYMRLATESVKGIKIINDSYNSNPSSMECALDALEHYPAKSKWVITGDMLELGKRGAYFHKKLGESISKLNIRGLVTFGNLSKYTFTQALRCGMNRDNLWHCTTHDEIADILRRVAERGDAVLIKGSRAMEMEKVIEKL